MRNPAIDFSMIWGASDIPDWALLEAGFPFDPATPPTPESLGVLRTMSPISHVSKVSCKPLAGDAV